MGSALLDWIAIDILPIEITINFILIVIFFLLSSKKIKKQFSKVSRLAWPSILLVFLFAFSLIMWFIPHQHLMYIDEPWYMEAAKNMLQKGKSQLCSYSGYNELKCTKYPKPIGWPFILAISFFFFGISSWVAINTSVLVSSLSVIAIFLIGYLISKREEIGLFAALVLSLNPDFLIWSATAETNAPSLFFILFTILGFLLYFKTKDFKILMLALSSLVFTTQIRVEYISLIFIPMILFIFDSHLKKRPKSPKKIRAHLKSSKFWIALLFLGVFLPFYYVQFVMMSELAENITRMSLWHFVRNLDYVKSLVFNWHPILLSPFLFLGLFYILKHNKTNFYLLSLLFLALFLIYLPFGRTVNRMLIPAYSIITLIIGHGLYSLSLNMKKKERRIYFVAVLLIIVASSYSLIRSSFDSHRTDTYTVQTKLETDVTNKIKNRISGECYIISEWPTTIMSASDIKTIKTIEALENPNLIKSLLNKTDCVLYYEDMFCFVSYEPDANQRCRQILDSYNLSPYINYEIPIPNSSQTIEYTFYKFNLNVL